MARGPVVGRSGENVGRDELLDALEAVLRTVGGVSGAAYFGSVARGTEDDLSDVDLVVRCDRADAKVLSRRLTTGLGVVLYRPFSAGRAPSGRYWFRRTHPFLRLDVSFHDRADYHRFVSDEGEFVRKPFRHIELGPQSHFQDPAGATLPEWSVVSEDYAGALRDYQEAAKALIRGKPPKRPLAEERGRVIKFGTAVLPEGAWDLFERSAAIVRDAGVG